MEKEEMMVLDHFILNLENNFEDLKEAYEKKDSEKFNEFKRLILQTQKKIYELLK